MSEPALQVADGMGFCRSVQCEPRLLPPGRASGPNLSPTSSERLCNAVGQNLVFFFDILSQLFFSPYHIQYFFSIELSVKPTLHTFPSKQVPHQLKFSNATALHTSTHEHVTIQIM
ncbi:hypothetical protein CEXT_436981 [Caerostris extrusa]|uniref:Uncharacterized protein n=1 Tax=Caerostris extrusa TaxID=172846 RepID=A0AAV4XFA1_CAEEX|nr:hypothetical protein CEXT_436981 [Caerostris extrusa]